MSIFDVSPSNREDKERLWEGYALGEIKFSELNETGQKAVLEYGLENDLIDKSKLKPDIVSKFGLDNFGQSTPTTESPGILERIGGLFKDDSPKETQSTTTRAGDNTPVLSSALSDYKDRFINNRNEQYVSAWDKARTTSGHGHRQSITSSVMTPDTKVDTTTANSIASYESLTRARNRVKVENTDKINSNANINKVHRVKGVVDNTLHAGKEAVKQGLVQMDISLLNIPRMLWKANTMITDALFPDSWYSAEEDSIMNGLDNTMEFLETYSEEIYQESGTEGMKWSDPEKFVYTGVSAMPTVIGSAVAGVGLAGASSNALKLTQGIVRVGAGTEWGMAFNIPKIARMAPFGVTAGSSYARDAENMGKSFAQQVMYGTTMGLMEAATEGPIVEGFLNTLTGKYIIREGGKSFIEKYGLTGVRFLQNIAKEGGQEAIMEPLSGLGQNVFLGTERPVYGDNGIIDPKAMVEAGYSGVAMSTMLGAFGLPASMTSHARAQKMMKRSMNGEVISHSEFEELKNDVEKDMTNITKEDKEMMKDEYGKRFAKQQFGTIIPYTQDKFIDKSKELLENPQLLEDEKFMNQIQLLREQLESGYESSHVSTEINERSKSIIQAYDQYLTQLQSQQLQSQEQEETDNVEPVTEEIIQENNVEDIIEPELDKNMDIPPIQVQNDIPVVDSMQEETDNIESTQEENNVIESDDLEIEESNEKLEPFGLTVTKDTTNNQNPVWEIHGENLEVLKEKLIPLGVKWFAPKGEEAHFSYYAEENPTEMIANALSETNKEVDEEIQEDIESNQSTVELKKGNIINTSKYGEVEILDDADPSMYTVKTKNGAELKIGKEALNDIVSDKNLEKVEQEQEAGPIEDITENKDENMGLEQTPYQQATDEINEYLKNKKKLSANKLYSISNKVYEGTMSEGKYDRKDAYDIMELAVNHHILNDLKDVNTSVKQNLKKLSKMIEFLPTQTARTEEQVKYQQFSTPPHLAYVVGWVANINKDDIVLEPSAGIGGLAIFGKIQGAEVVVNELSERRLSVLKNLPFDHFYNENAEQIDNILPQEIKPTVVLMNPPFSSTAGRMKNNNTKYAKAHIEQALNRLDEGGRLVAIVGKGMADDAPAFRIWWKDIKAKHSVRANIGVSGKNYRKYGTSFDNRVFIIDKTGPTVEETLTGKVETLEELIDMLGGIQSDRFSRTNLLDSGHKQTEQVSSESDSKETSKESESGTGEHTTRIPIDRVGDESSGSGVQQRSGKNKSNEPSGKNDVSKESRSDDKVRDKSGKQHIPKESNNNKRSSTDGDVSLGRNKDTNRRRRVKEQNEEIKVESKKENDNKAEKQLTDSIFSEYEPQKIKIKGAKKHPGELVESAAMSAVQLPSPRYNLHLPKKLITKGELSLAQLETIAYAGQAHSELLPNETRRGFFIGDGTGTGKGREISGIIMDNFAQGRKKALWISKNASLYEDAVRDWNDLGGDSKDITAIEKYKLKSKESISKENGIVYLTYGQLSSGNVVSSDGLRKKEGSGGTRIDQLVEWLGKDFDGVIAFDEAHLMKNSIKINKGRQAQKPSLRGIAGVELQKIFPKARIVYVSATGATEVENLAYAERLGLWGEGTAFATKDNFIDAVNSGGIAAMELVAQDMKASGGYLARSLSYNGIGYERLTHSLTNNQRKIYDDLAEAWQVVMQNVNKALEATSQGLDGRKKGNAWGQFWSGQQRFFNQILTSMQMPSVIRDMKSELSKGNACVLQIVNTNEATQERQAAKLEDEGGSLEELDLTPRDLLLEYLDKSFPIQQFEEYEDDNGSKRSRPVYDSKGKPVVSQEAVRLKNELIERIGSIKVPDGPLEIVLNEFGSKNIAEVTGRSRRFVEKKDEKTGRIKRAEERRSKSKVANDVELFMNDKKKILVFSEAGGTGKSYHSDLRSKNQRQRIHYLIQAGFKAEAAVQGFGRTHRTNEANKPVYKLVTTDLKGHMRFISTIARRLDQLGALTRGQRQTGSQGLFSEKDNLENVYAKDALKRFYRELANTEKGKEAIEKMGLKDKLLDEYGYYKGDQDTERDVTKFLNRILALDYNLQNSIFEGFTEKMESMIETAIKNGTLETGLENFKADSITIEDEIVVRTDDKTGVETKYIQVKALDKVKKFTYKEIQNKYGDNLLGFYKNEISENTRALVEYGNKTMINGDIQKVYRLYSPKANDYILKYENELLQSNWKKLSESDAKKIWETEYKKTSEIESEKLHLISGTLLPIWDRLPQSKVRVMRLLTDDSRMLLGRLIPEREIDYTLQKLGAERNKENYSIADLVPKILEQNYKLELANGWKIVRKKVAGENRIEIIGNDIYDSIDTLNKQGVFTEVISFTTRYFVPVKNAKDVLISVTKYRPIIDVIVPEKANNKNSSYNQASGYVGEVSKTNNPPAKNTEPKNIKRVSTIVKDMSKYFKVPVSSARYRRRKYSALYKPYPEAIETKIDNNLGPIMHEIGHHLDKKYELSKNYTEDVSKMIKNLDPKFESAYSKEELPGEAIAEFVRMYLTAPSKAIEFNGDFFDKFESTLSVEDLKHISTMRNDILNWLGADTQEKIESTIVSYTEKDNEDFSSKKLNAYMELVDVLKPIDLFHQTVEKLSGKKVSEGDNAYLKALLSLNSDAVARTQITEALTNLEGDIIATPLKEIYNKISKHEFRPFDGYLKAVHSLDWHTQGKRVFSDDFDLASMQEEIEAYEEKYPHFKETAADLYNWWQTFINSWVVDTGLMEAETWDKLKEIYPHYIPLFRVQDNYVNTGNGMSKAKRGYANQTTPLKRASMRGSAKDTYSALESFILETDRIVKIAKRNDVMQTIHEHVNNTEGLGFILKKVPPKMLPSRFKAVDLKVDLITKLAENYIENEIDQEVKKKIKKMELAEALEYLVQEGYEVPNIIDNTIDDITTFFTPETFSKDSNVVTVVDKDNNKHFYEVYDKYFLEAVLNLETPQLDKWVRLIGSIKRTMTVLITGGNPVFGITSNIWRDVPQAFIMGSFKNPVKFASEIGKAFNDVIKNDETLIQYHALGAGHASPVGANRKVLEETLNELIPGRKKQVKHLADFLISRIEQFNDAIETMPRLAEYRNIIENEGDSYSSRVKAVYAANDVTLNFMRHGKIRSSIIGQGIPFLNAGIQGLDKLYRAGTKDKKELAERVAKALTAVTLFSIIQTLAYSDDEDYKDLSNYIKDNYWLIKYDDGKFIRIPKPRELGFLFGTTFQRLMRKAAGDDKAFEELDHSFKQNFIPPLRTIAHPLIDVWANKSWSGTPIVSQRFSSKPDLQYDEKTSEIAKGISKVLPDSAGVFKSPINIQYLIKQYSGIFGQLVIPATTKTEGVTGAAEGISRKMKTDVAFSNKWTNKFYDYKEELQEMYDEEKQTGKTDDKYSNKYRKRFNKQSQWLSKRWSKIRDINKDESLTAKEKKEQVRSIRLEIMNKAKHEVLKYESMLKDKGF